MTTQNIIPTIEGAPLIEALLREQREPTAVEQFSRRHDAGQIKQRDRYYRDLIPLTAPGPGQQYAFEVDLDACSGCKACVAACHNLNGLDDTESWRDVGALIGGSVNLPVIQHVTTACHHCLDPACLTGCPVDAYVKDPATGIVKHLDDQCIGCQYCTFKCPYDAPKYNPKRGIVRKCDMCSQRLAVGEAPACVQACPASAIRIRLVDQKRIVEDSEANVFLPGAPEPDYTLPTTTYVTARSHPRNLLPADYFTTAPQHAHPPLVAMLVLTQLSVGAFAAERALVEWVGRIDRPVPLHAIVALAVGLLALAANTLHLGRPLYAFRAVIGLRHSWLSREIVGFGVFAALATAFAGAAWLAPWFLVGVPERALGWAVVAAGLIAVFCSVMVYHDTHRDFWRFHLTAPKFFLTTGMLGLGTVLVTWGHGPTTRTVVTALVIIGALKLITELAPLHRALDRKRTHAQRTAMLMLRPLRGILIARLICGGLGVALLPLILHINTYPAARFHFIAIIALILAIAGELMERYLFFAAAVAPKMPGGQPS